MLCLRAVALCDYELDQRHTLGDPRIILHHYIHPIGSHGKKSHAYFPLTDICLLPNILSYMSVTYRRLTLWGPCRYLYRYQGIWELCRSRSDFPIVCSPLRFSPWAHFSLPPIAIFHDSRRPPVRVVPPMNDLKSLTYKYIHSHFLLNVRHLGTHLPFDSPRSAIRPCSALWSRSCARRLQELWEPVQTGPSDQCKSIYQFINTSRFSNPDIYLSSHMSRFFLNLRSIAYDNPNSL